MSSVIYSPLVGMFCEIDKIHKRALRLVLNAFDCKFETLLLKVNECTIHQRNLQKIDLGDIQMPSMC